MPVASKDVWEKWKIIWETDPKMTFAGVAEGMGVSRQGVSMRAKKDKWAKLPNAPRIAAKAHQKADATPTVSEPLTMPDPGPITGAEALSNAIEEGAVDARAKIISRHRVEWNAARSNIYKAIKSGSFDQAKLAKITSEALKIVQDGERKAWGLDVVEKPETGEIIRG